MFGRKFRHHTGISHRPLLAGSLVAAADKMLEVQQWLWKLRHGWLLLSAAQAYAFVVILPALFKSNWVALKALFGNDEFIFGATSPW